MQQEFPMEAQDCADTTPPPEAQPEPEERDYLTIKEFRDSLRISYSTYRKLRAKGKMPTETRLSSKLIRISKQAIAEWKLNDENKIGEQLKF